MFHHSAFLVVVFGAKILEWGDAHHVVGSAEYEVQYEIGLVEVECAIIDGHVDVLVGVDVMKGGVPVDAIDFLPGLAGEQSDLNGGVGVGKGDGVHQLVGGKCHIATTKEEQQNQELKP